MDTPLLAKMVKELILAHDAVTLPGIGTFVAELIGAAFADKGYAINPPYRRLSFTQREGSDSLLVDMYAEENDIPAATAEQVMVDFLKELREELVSKKAIVLPELGRLRATRENHFFFIADEDLDIYPDGFGLETLSLKTHEQTPEELSAAVAGLAASLAPEVKPEPEKEVAVEKEGPQQKPVEVVAAKRPRRHRVLRIFLILIGLAGLALLAFLLTARFAPDWLDTLLYSEEELELLRSL